MANTRARKEGPWTIEIRRQDVIDLVRFLTEPVQKTDANGQPIGPARPKTTTDRDDRMALKEALTALGAMKIWNLVRKPGGAKPEEMVAVLPERYRRELTLDKINTLLKRLDGERDIVSSLNLAQLEEDLLDAKNGNYELPEEEAVEPNGAAPTDEPLSVAD